jgi:hypothetical protein
MPETKDVPDPTNGSYKEAIEGFASNTDASNLRWTSGTIIAGYWKMQ